MHDLKDKIILVTGASGGIGKATALLLCKAGAKLGLLDVNEPELVVAEVKAQGGEAVAVACDVRDSKSVEHAIGAVVAAFGPLDGAANLAGVIGKGRQIGTTEGSLASTSDEEWDRVIGINLTGVKNCMKSEIHHINKAGGSIVNAASVAGQTGTPYNSPYGTSKAGVIGLTKSVAKETGLDKIRINAIAPGVVETPMVLGLGSAESLKPWMSANALGRPAQPEKIAKMILWLLSDDSSYCTASVFNIDAGR